LTYIFATFVTFHAVIFDAQSQEVLAKNGF